jgi:rubrerythrin
MLSFCCMLQCTSFINEGKTPDNLKTVDILKNALKESLSSYKYYDNCANQAYKENYYEVGKFFDQLSLSNKVRSVILKDNLKQFKIETEEDRTNYPVKTTRENVQKASEMLKASQTFYKESIRVAEEENLSSAKVVFFWIYDTQKKYLFTVKNFMDLTEKK